MSTSSRTKRKKKQTHLGFEPIDLTSDASPQHPNSSLSPARVTYLKEGPNSDYRKRGGIFAKDVDLGTPLRAFRERQLQESRGEKRNGKLSFEKIERGERGEIRDLSLGRDMDGGDDSTDDGVTSSVRRKKGVRSSGGSAKNLGFMGRHSTPTKQPSSGSKHSVSDKRRQGKAIQISSDEETSDEEQPILPTPRRTQQLTSSSKLLSSDSEEEDIVPLRSSQRPRKALVVPDEEDEAEEELPDVSRLKAHSSQPSKRARDASDEEEDSDEPVISSPAKRRRVTQPGSTSRMENKNGKARPAENSDSPTTPSRLLRQKQPKRHRTDKEKMMELLKRKRAGEKIDKLTSSEESDDNGEGGIYDTDEEYQALSQFDDEEEEETASVNEERLRQSVRAQNRDNYDDDFVVDDDGELGAPLGLHDIPLEFTHQAHKPQREHFKDCVEWMVQRKVSSSTVELQAITGCANHHQINPGFPSDDPIYTLAFRKLDDEVRGLANSKFTSSIWKEDFTRALWARPEFMQSEHRSMDENHCGACGRNHPTSFIIQFSGSPYSTETLEEVDQDSSESSDSDNSADDIDDQGRKILSADKQWYVGSHCKANAETAHMLIHWKWALNSWVQQQLDDDGHSTPAKLAERDKWSTKKRGKYAIAIVDRWEANRVLKGIYRDFKNTLEEARNSQQSRYRTSRD